MKPEMQVFPELFLYTSTIYHTFALLLKKGKKIIV